MEARRQTGVIFGGVRSQLSEQTCIRRSCVLTATSAMLEQASLLLSQVNSLFEDREKQLEEVRSRKHLGC